MRKPTAPTALGVFAGCAIGFGILAGCAALPFLQAAVAADQLFCATTYPSGAQAVVALTTDLGVPVHVQGATSKFVHDQCALIGGIPVSPPPVPSAAPIVAAPPVVVGG